jgi:rhamnulokinase
VPTTPAEYARCIFDSLADAYVKVLDQLQDAAGVRIDSINIVGGASANKLLNQLTANATGKTVYAGPVEATVLGSIITQMQAAGVINSLEEGRQIIKNSTLQAEFKPA